MTETLVRGDDGDNDHRRELVSAMRAVVERGEPFGRALTELLAQGWDEGYVQAVFDLTPAGLTHDDKLMFQVEHEGRNPYREGT